MSFFQTIKKSFSSFSFRKKVILLLLSMTYVALGLSALIVNSIGKQTLQEEIHNTLSNTVDITLQSINRTIYQRLNDLQLLISDSTLSNSQIDNEEKSRILRKNLIQLGWYDNIYLTNTTGTIVSATDRTSIGKKVNQQEWYQEAERDFIAISDLIRSDFTGKDTVVLANTVFNEKNEFQGILFAEFSWAVIEDLLENTPEQMEIFLFNGQSRIISAKHVSGQFPTIYELETNTENYVTSGKTSEGYLGFDGNQWQLIIRIPTSAAYAVVNSFTRSILLSVAIISFIIFFAGGLFARVVVNRIKILTEGVFKLKEGNLSHRIKIPGKDEIGFLAQNFNSMAQSILRKTRKILAEKGRYAAILESSNEAMILFSIKNKASAFNKSFLSLFKLKSRGLRSKKAEKILNFLFDKKTEYKDPKKGLEIQKLIKSNDYETSLASEIIIHKPKYYILRIYTKPVTSQDGNLLGRIWVFRDITEEKEAEQVKNDFISVASHKIRTPLSVINWTIESLLDGVLGKLNKKQKEAINKLSDQSHRFQKFADELMTIAEIQEEEIKIKKEKVSVQKILEHLTKEAKKKNYDPKRTIVKFPNKKFKDLFVKADPKIFQIASSILDNALRYGSDKRKNNIKVNVKAEGNKAVFTISDSGIGLSAKEKGKLFTKFFRGKNALKKHTEGIGLNLYLASIFFKSSKENIKVESKKDKGTTVTFTLALTKS